MVSLHTSHIMALYQAVQGWHRDFVPTWNVIISWLLAWDADNLTSLASLHPRSRRQPHCSAGAGDRGWLQEGQSEGRDEGTPGEGAALVCMALIELSQSTLFGHNPEFFYGRCLNWDLCYEEDLCDLPRHKAEADSSAAPGLFPFTHF